MQELLQIQKLPLSKKNKEWRERQVDHVINSTTSSSNTKSIKEMNRNIDLYLGNFNIDDIKYVLDPFNVDDGFPAMPHNINVIKPKVDLLIGEEINTRAPLTVLCTSQHSSQEINKKMVGDLTNFMLHKALANMGEQEMENFQAMLESGEIADPKEILGLSGNLEYKSLIEESARSLMEYLSQKNRLKDVFTSGFFNLLWSAKQIYLASVQSGAPCIECINPIEFRNTYSSNNVSDLYRRIEDSEMITRKVYMTPTEAYDRLYHLCDEKDLDAILDLGRNAGIASGKGSLKEPDYMHIRFTKLEASSIEGMIPVYHVLWRSFKKIGLLVTQDEYGVVSSEIVSEDYVKVGNEISLTWDWIPEIWEGYRVGDSVYIGINPLEYQYVNKENLLDQKMPYFGIELVGSKSIVDSIVPLQYLYIIVWYRLELALAKDKGKVLSMDVRKIPRSLGVDTNKWLHLLASVGVNFYNPDETGFDNNEDGRDRNSDRMITAEDLSMTNVISSYIGILQMIDDVIDQVTGISRQRAGFVKSSEYVGSVEQSIGQSNLITENLFEAHDSCRTAVSRYFLNLAKDHYYNTNNRFLSYITSDGARMAATLSDDFFFEDFDVFATSSRKESKDLELVKQLYQPAMQNGATLSDIVDVITLNSVKAIQNKLREIDEKKAIAMQQAEALAAQREAEALELERQAREIEVSLRLQELDLEKYKIDMANSTKIAVAELQALGFAGDGTNDETEIINRAKAISEILSKASKERLEEMKEENSNNLKKMDLSLKRDKLASDKRIDRQKLELEKKRLELEKRKLNSQNKK